MVRYNAEILKKHPLTHARSMQVTTPHGIFKTPAFMTVGTRAFVNQMRVDDLNTAGSRIILGGNTYHMICSPGLEVIKRGGGMHAFMGWHGPMLTDSGGFQLFSLSNNSDICTINDNGARFKHPVTSKIYGLTPKSAIEAQKVIGADIIMALDECTPEQGGREAACAALERTHRWLGESIEAHAQHPDSYYGHRQALFGIIQGGSFRDLREQSAQFIVNANLEGIAIGGEAIGFDMQKTLAILDWVRPILPEDKVRYTMGVGLNPQNLIDVVREGVDIFDCVAPTRNARHGSLYHGQIVPDGDWFTFSGTEKNARILIKKSQYANDESPILEGCQCFTCKHHSRAYLHYLFKEKLSGFSNLACIHNLHVMNHTCQVMRDHILDN